MARASVSTKPRRVTYTPAGCDPVVFGLRPLDILTDAQLVASTVGLTGQDASEQRALEYGMRAVIASVVEWSGVDGEDGQPAPCDEPHKLEFFRQYPDAYGTVADALNTGGGDLGNGFGGGPESVEPSPGSTVEDSSHGTSEAAPSKVPAATDVTI